MVVARPRTKAPSLAHILWTKPISFGGLSGGTINGSALRAGNTYGLNYYTGLLYENKLAEWIINGYMYLRHKSAWQHVCKRLARSRLRKLAHWTTSLAEPYYATNNLRSSIHDRCWSNVRVTSVSMDSLTGWVNLVSVRRFNGNIGDTVHKCIYFNGNVRSQRTQL